MTLGDIGGLLILVLLSCIYWRGSRKAYWRGIQAVAYQIVGGFCGLLVAMAVANFAEPTDGSLANLHGWQAVYYSLPPAFTALCFPFVGVLGGLYLAIIFSQQMKVPKNPVSLHDEQ
jgi:hypothetical protein